ncbi:hypothetical protein PAV_1c13050 [Paenibacillus alvei DSM 29]|nr:hypothetical protein PAV_1c13050 [Paenibacillus alvei DSM 29]
MRQFITLLFSLDPCFILTLSRKLIFKYPGKTGTSCTIRGSGLILYFLLNNWFSIVGNDYDDTKKCYKQLFCY